MFNSQGHIAMGNLQVEETSAYCTVNHRASASNYQLSNMKRPARDLNGRPQRLEARTLTATPPSPLITGAIDSSKREAECCDLGEIQLHTLDYSLL